MIVYRFSAALLSSYLKLIRLIPYCGSVSRMFTLDEGVEQDTMHAMHAKYENGVLQLTLPKKHNGQSHVLKIA